MAAVSFSMGKFIAGIVIAILAASVISVGVSMLVPGPQGPEGPQGDTGPQGERGFGVPQQGNISISYSAFVPPSSDDSGSYSYNYGLRNTDGSTLSYCSAPLQLPHGATITNATFYFYDNTPAISSSM